MMTVCAMGYYIDTRHESGPLTACFDCYFASACSIAVPQRKRDEDVCSLGHDTRDLNACPEKYCWSCPAIDSCHTEYADYARELFYSGQPSREVSESKPLALDYDYDETYSVDDHEVLALMLFEHESWSKKPIRDGGEIC